MSRIDSQQGLMPSLLDRLIDPEADGTPWKPGYDVNQLIASVHRDLEELLNTRYALEYVPPDCTEVLKSIVVYGMPDVSSFEVSSVENRARIGRVLEAIILHHEPRLRSVKASLVDPTQATNRTVKFRIEAKLRVEPAPEVAFDTILELSTGHSTVTRPENVS